MNMIMVKLIAIRDEHGDFQEWKIEDTKEIRHTELLDELKALELGDLKRALQDFLDGKTIDIVSGDSRVVMTSIKYGYRGYDKTRYDPREDV